jgi:hypothetical protein
MITTRSIVSAFAASTILLFTSLAHAQRTFVASTGNDTNACTRTAPCRTLQVAVNAAPAGGEVVALDDVAYGPIVINKSMTISGPPGQYTGITVPSGVNGVSITGGTSVVLRGITIMGATGSLTGINITAAGATVTVENCRIQDMGNIGINFNPTTGLLFVRDTVVNTCANGGVLISGTSGAARAMLQKVTVDSCAFGIKSAVHGLATARDCSVSSTTNGFWADGTGATGSNGGRLTIIGGTATHNTVGLEQSGTHAANNDDATNQGAGVFTVLGHTYAFQNTTDVEIVGDFTTIRSDSTNYTEVATGLSNGTGYILHY